MKITTIGRWARVFGTLAFVLGLSMATGCATIVKGTTQGIPVNSTPPGAEVLVDGLLVGETPVDVEMKRKRDHLVVIQKDGYEPKSVPVLKNVGGAVFGNILAGGLIGWGVDAASGAQNNLNPKTINVTLQPVGEGGASSSANNSSVGVEKLNQLDQMLENEQISEEEYSQGRLAILKEYFPELLPPEEQGDTAGEAADTEKQQEVETENEAPESDP